MNFSTQTDLFWSNLRNSNLSYRDRLIKLNLLPLNYWLEYLDLVFFFKCLHGDINLTRSFNYYFSLVTSQTRHAASGLNFKLHKSRTSTFRDFYINRIIILWNSLPNAIKQAESLDSFKRKIKSFYFNRLNNVFDGNNFSSFKVICPKCRRVNTHTVCSC